MIPYKSAFATEAPNTLEKRMDIANAIRALASQESEQLRQRQANKVISSVSKLQFAAGWLHAPILEGGPVMVQTIKIAPPNSLIFVSDQQGGSVPDPDQIAREAGITATDSCVVVCCLAEMDGQTEITMGSAPEVDRGENPGFDSTLATPSRTVVVSTVGFKKLLEENVPTRQTRIRVWTNYPKEPDKVVIGIG